MNKKKADIAIHNGMGDQLEGTQMPPTPRSPNPLVIVTSETFEKLAEETLSPPELIAYLRKRAEWAESRIAIPNNVSYWMSRAASAEQHAEVDNLMTLTNGNEKAASLIISAIKSVDKFDGMVSDPIERENVLDAKNEFLEALVAAREALKVSHKAVWIGRNVSARKLIAENGVQNT